MTPQAILYAMIDHEDISESEMISKRDIKNIIENFKNKNESVSGKNSLTMADLTKFVNENSKTPPNEDTAFVVSFERSPPNQKHDKYFRIFISTPRLLRTAALAKNLHADGTHKVTCEKLPLIVIGSTDMDQSFHLIGLAIVSDETTEAYRMAFNAVRLGVLEIAEVDFEPEYLVSDADPAIHNGFKLVYGQRIPIIMCYAHVMRNVQQKYKFKDAKNKPLILKDMRVLHNCVDERSFNMGSELFLLKWSTHEPEVTRKINGSFFKKNFNWRTTSYFRVPKTNNALESFNGNMKAYQTFNKKKPLKQFLFIAMKIVRQRSKAYRQHKSEFRTEIQISDTLMQSGLAFNKAYVYKPPEDNNKLEFFVFSAHNEHDHEITLQDVHEFETAYYDSWEEFEKFHSDIWKITFPASVEDWKMSTCTCPSFNDNFMCKHIIGIAYDAEIIVKDPEGEENYDDMPLFENRQKGRPKKPTSALNFD